MNGPLSKRKLFNAIVPDQRILSHLDSLRLGYLAKRRSRVTLAKKHDGNDQFDYVKNFRDITRIRGVLQNDQHNQRREDSPYPFNKAGKFLFKAADWRAVPEKFPGNPPEIAIIGRSNVGKSTLLNCLLALEEAPLVKATVSQKPGETKHLQFYSVGRNKTMQKNEYGIEEVASGPALIITDMPGFGFAFMNEEDQLRTSEISKKYLTERGPNLKRVLLLIDSRHGLKIGDEKFFKDLFSKNSVTEEGRSQTLYPGDKGSLVKWKLQIVLTKCDLVERFELVRRIQVLKDKLIEILPNIGYTGLPILAISSTENRGVVELKKVRICIYICIYIIIYIHICIYI
jgi:GTP-binding protein EngB required for normal cell division